MSPRRRHVPPEAQAKLIQLDNALEGAVQAGATPDEILKQLLDNETVFGPIFKVHVKAAMAGSVQSSKWLFDRAYGTASQTIQHSGQVNLKGVFADPLDSEDELYLEDGEEPKQLEP